MNIKTHTTMQYGLGEVVPPRPDVLTPPLEVDPLESRYIQQLLEAYSDHKKELISYSHQLDSQHKEYKSHFSRQREIFYHAESLKNFARDTVPEGTFEALQNEIYHGVVDKCDSEHVDDFKCVKDIIAQAATININSNALLNRIKTQDKQGICHHLANEDRLKWVKSNEG